MQGGKNDETDISFAWPVKNTGGYLMMTRYGRGLSNASANVSLDNG